MKPLLLLLLLPLTALGQAPTATPAPVQSALPLWRCTLPGGTYSVALRSITGVSSHEYLIDGGVRVTEVNIATSGSLLARFYYLEPITNPVPGLPAAGTLEKAQALLVEGANRTGADVWKKVLKSYPTSTHAHTVEYRLESKESVTALFNSVESSFRLQKPGAYQGQ
jgi:hypothetical protein